MINNARLEQLKVAKYRQRKTHTEPKHAKDTPQGFSSVFNDYAKYITRELNEHAYRQNDPEVARLYIDYQQLITNWCKLAKENLPDCPVLPDLPILTGNDYYAGLIHLRDYCAEVAKKIMDKEHKPAGNISGMSWKDVRAKAEAIVAKNGFPGVAKLSKDIGCDERTLNKAIKKSPKLQKAKRLHKPCSSKAVGLTEKVLETQEDPSGSLMSDAEVNEILDDLLKETAEKKPEMLEQTKRELDNMDSDGKRKLAEEYNRNHKHTTLWNESKTPRQYKQI